MSAVTWDLAALQLRFERTLNTPYYDEGAAFVAASLVGDVTDWLLAMGWDGTVPESWEGRAAS